MNYSDMSDEQFEKEFRNLFGDGALVTEVFARFKDKCEEVAKVREEKARVVLRFGEGKIIIAGIEGGEMRAYMGFSREAGSQEAAILIFAHNCKEARRLAFPFISDWGDGGWLDVAVKWLKDAQHLFDTEANKEKITAGIPHVIDSPKTCERCELWGKAMNEHGVCEDCIDLEESEFDTERLKENKQ